jgi:hypothetical protein
MSENEGLRRIFGTERERERGNNRRVEKTA